MGADEVIFIALVGLIGVGAGIAVGLLISGARSERNAASSQPKSRTNLFEIATVWQDRKSGRIYPEVNGNVIRYPAELSASQRERLVNHLANLLGWLTPTAVEKESPVAAGEKPATDTEITPSYPSSSQPKLSAIDMVARAVQPSTRPLEKPPQSIAAQIDEILQEKLSGSPLDSRGIRLMELPGKGMVILVGLERYEDIDSVPDDEIRTLLRQSVAEWEQRSSSE